MKIIRNKKKEYICKRYAIDYITKVYTNNSNLNKTYNEQRNI
jgi:hypothetical protein